jgi:hypothetical protein
MNKEIAAAANNPSLPRFAWHIPKTWGNNPDNTNEWTRRG